MANEIKKVICHSCGCDWIMDNEGLSYLETNSLDDYLCEECGSAVTITEQLSAEEVIDYMAGELENVNHGDLVSIPEKLFDNIKDEFIFDDEQALALAKILNEVFSELYF